MRRASANDADDNNLLNCSDRSRELNERFASILTGLPPMDPLSPPRTPPRSSPSYDDIPTAAVVPQSPVISGYTEHAVHHSPNRAYGTTFNVGSTDARAFQSPPRASSNDELVDGLFQLGLSPGSPATSFGVNLTPTRGSSAYGSSAFERDDSARSTSASPASPKQQHSLYKTELCRSWEESGACRYGAKCQFAHGRDELRPVLRHPKYKTEVCRTFAAQGCCPYGSRCRFIHYRPTESGAAASSAANSRGDALSALVFAARGSSSSSEWTDPFLGTPPPLDPRPSKHRDRRDAAEESRLSADVDLSADADLSADLSADASALRVGESALEESDDDTSAVLSPRTRATAPKTTTDTVAAAAAETDAAETDVFPGRHPVFADIAASPTVATEADTKSDESNDVPRSNR